MVLDELCHLEPVYPLALLAHHPGQLGVRNDVAAVLGVLELVRLHIGPDPLDNLRPGGFPHADDIHEGRVALELLVEGLGVASPLGLLAFILLP